MHTLERFRDCFYRPLLSSTENFDRWTRNGGQDAAERAAKIWRDTLEAYEPPPIDDGMRSQLQEFVSAPPRGAGRLSTDGLIADRAYTALRDRIVTLRLRAGHGAARGRADARAGDRPHAAARGGQAARARGPRRRPAAQRHVRHGVDAADIVHISEVRAELEAHAAELAARRLDDELRERVEALLDRSRERRGQRPTPTR